MPTCRSASSRSGASSSSSCHRRTTGCRCWAGPWQAFIAQGYTYIGMDHFALPGGRTGRSQAPGPAAPQLPGLQHPARLRPDCPGRVGHRPHGCHLQPERQDACRVLRRGAPGAIPHRARPGADARRPGAPGGDHGADVPGAAGVRVHRAGAPDQDARLLQVRTGRPAPNCEALGLCEPAARRRAGHCHRLVLRARHCHGVRQAPAVPTRCASASRASSDPATWQG